MNNKEEVVERKWIKVMPEGPIYQETKIVAVAKSRRLQWLRHMERMTDKLNFLTLDFPKDNISWHRKSRVCYLIQMHSNTDRRSVG